MGDLGIIETKKRAFAKKINYLEGESGGRGKWRRVDFFLAAGD